MTYLTSCSTSGLADRYAKAIQNIADAERDAQVTAGSTKLIVVSKTHPAELVLELMQLGSSDFGENRDQEASPKAAAVAQSVAEARANQTFSGPDAAWHFIGQLQSNKVKSVLRYASSIHSLDRPSLLKALVKELATQETKNRLPVFIELNLTGQPERGGILPENLIEFATEVCSHDTLKLEGVMGVAGLDVEPAFDFDRIRKSSEQLQTIAPDAKYISAGMSNDYEIAIRHGATHVRIGTSITGKREYSV